MSYFFHIINHAGTDGSPSVLHPFRVFCLYCKSFIYVEGHGGVSRKVSVILDDHVFIRDNAVELYVIAHVGILKEYAVLYHSSLAYLYPAEEDGVLHRTFDYTAVSHERALDRAVLAIFCGG